MTSEAPRDRIDFALLGHPSSYDHLGDVFRHTKPDFDVAKLQKHRPTLTKFFEWTPSYVSSTQLEICTPANRRLTGRLIICSFLPEWLDNPRALMNARKKTFDGCKLAQELRSPVVGLGGFTSIVGGSQGADLADHFQLAVTSGNSLTAALAIAQVETVLDRLRWSLADRTLAVIGATGDIGKACVKALGKHARRVILLARNRAKLDELKAELAHVKDVCVSTNLSDAAGASVVIAATSAAKPIMNTAELKPGTLVCDIGYPKNLMTTMDGDAGVLAVGGGVAQLPFDLDIMYQTQLPRPDLMYGCFSEAILLALSRRHESFSTGQGRIDEQRMDEILSLAREHGFKPAPLYRGHRLVTDDDFNAFLAHAAARGEN